jgi:hypothetical protein
LFDRFIICLQRTQHFCYSPPSGVLDNREFGDGRTSKVRNNRITNLFSANATYVIGIDVQGDAKGFEIVGNFIDLKASATFDLSDVYNALIIGQNADDGGTSSTIVLNDNTFAQEYIIQNGSTDINDGSDERQLRGLDVPSSSSSAVKRAKVHTKNISGEGCPLGYS